jgi:hypothetical protein
LEKLPEVVTARPVLSDLAVGDVKDVNVLDAKLPSRDREVPERAAGPVWRPLAVTRTTTFSPSEITSSMSKLGGNDASTSLALRRPRARSAAAA